MVGWTAWRGISREAATTLSGLGKLHRAGAELPGEAEEWAKSENSLGALVRGPLAPREALTATESGKGAQRHSVSAPQLLLPADLIEGDVPVRPSLHRVLLYHSASVSSTSCPDVSGFCFVLKLGFPIFSADILGPNGWCDGKEKGGGREAVLCKARC